MDCVRYGLMELGGFVRNTVLDRQQRSHMFTHERANLVMFESSTSCRGQLIQFHHHLYKLKVLRRKNQHMIRMMRRILPLAVCKPCWNIYAEVRTLHE